MNLLLQLINVVLGTAAGGVLAALAQTLFERNDVSVACLLLYVLFLPTLLFNTFVYGVLPMVLLTVCAFFCFARHVRTKKRGYAAAYALCIGIAAVMKPNAMLVALALFICSLLVAVEERDDIIILASIFSLMLCVVLPRMVVLFYEYRVGVTLESNTGSITRFAMGMQDSPIAAGWFNGYSESIWPRSWSWYSAKGVIAKESMGLLEPMADFAAVERETALAAIRERLAQMGADPGMTLRFYREKLLTQWLEPECDILWMLNVSEKTGRYDGLARMVCGDGQALHAAITAYLAVLQRVIYALAFAGGVSALRKKWESVLLMIPVTVLGGVLYHLLFEAKSQYAYPYIVYLMPFAAQGLCLAEDAVRCRWQKIKKQ